MAMKSIYIEEAIPGKQTINHKSSMQKPKKTYSAKTLPTSAGICTRDFEDGMKRVSKRDYSKTKNILLKVAKHSLAELEKIFEEK